MECKTCRFWLPHNPENGECRFAPPTPLVVGMRQVSKSLVTSPQQPAVVPIVQSVFPPTAATGGCGCHQVKK